MSKRYFSADDIADIKNARGFNVPWDRIAGHYGATVEELQVATGEPQWKPEPAKSDVEPVFDLWAADRLEGVL